VRDDARQLQIAEALGRRAARGPRLYVPLTVVLELEWVLRSRYRLSKTAMLQVFARLLETRELEFQDEPAVEEALHQYRRGSAGFAECLHLGCASAAGQLPLLSFDRKAARMPGAAPAG
jgi:predicted nucleic-acid-binding protein